MTKYTKISLFLFFFNFVFTNDGCIDPSACNYNSNADNDDGSCLYEYGCTDVNAINFDGYNYCEDLSSCQYAPVLNIPDLSVNEDNTLEIDLSLYSSDQNNNISYYTLVSISNSANAVINGELMTVTFNQNYNGYIYTQVRVTDSTGYTDVDSFYIEVIAVNDPPLIDSPPYLEATLNQQYTYVLRGNDVDNSMFTFSLYNNEPGMIIEEDFGFESRIVFTPLSSQGWIAGQSFSFSVSVSDGEYIDSASYTVNVISENNNVPPEILINNLFQVNEDESIQINFQVNDEDSNISASDISVVLDYDQHSYYNPFQYPVVSGNQSSLFQFTANPYDDWNGDVTIIIDIDDGSSWSSANTTINVNPVNDNPFIEAVSYVNTSEGSTVSPKFYVYDIDSSPTLNDEPYDFSNMSCLVTNISANQIIEFQEVDTGQQWYSGVSIGGYNAIHYFTKVDFFTSGDNLDWFGTEEFLIECQDDEGNTDSESFNVEFININDAPIMNLFDDDSIEIDEDSSISINVSGIDIDNEDVTFIVNESSGGSDNLSVEINQTGSFENGQGDAELIITPNPNYNGEDQIEVYLIDGGNLESNKILIDIIINPIDDTPIVTAIEKSMNEDESLVIELDGSINDTNSLVCNNNLSDNGSILCDCSSPALVGSCDIEGESLTYNYTDPEHGTLSLNGSIITYTPQSDFFGTDSFTYTVFDDNDTGVDNLYSNTATVSITVNAVNDAPELSQILDQEINEDNIFIYQINAIDVDDELLAYSIDYVSNYYSVILDEDLKELRVIPFANYNGDLDITIFVSDEEYTVSESFKLTVNPVNDSPISNDIAVELIEDDCNDVNIPWSSYNDNSSICNNSFSDNDSILCDCENNSFVGSCDLDNNDLLCFVDDSPSNGSVYEDNGTWFYQPNPDYYGSDQFSYYCCDYYLDLNNNNIVLDLCSESSMVTISITDQNDQPLFNNCVDNNSDSICDNTLNLENIAIPDVILYEDCNEQYSSNNDACLNYQGISIQQIRTGFNPLSENECSQLNTWYDNDCIDGSSLDVSYGIAVTSDLNDVSKGSWQYLINGESEFKDFIFSDFDGFACDYILLDDNDRIRFVPNDNEKSDFGQILTYPSFVFYAWDQTSQNVNGSCVSFNDDSNSACSGSSTPLSNLAQKAYWEIKSVNDPPQVLMNDFTNSLFGDGYVDVSYDGIDANLVVYEDALNAIDNKKLSLRLSSDSEESFFIFEDIDSELSFIINDNGNSIISSNLDLSLDSSILDLNTIENMNGNCILNIGVTDGEFTESVDLNIDVLQVNDPINAFAINDGISSYFNNIENSFINEQTMFDTPGYIKYQNYIPNDFPTPNNYLNEHTSQLASLNALKPTQPSPLFFQWDNNVNYIQDVDSDPNYNSQDNLYDVFYRLELLNQTDNLIHVLNDSMSVNSNEFEFTDMYAKTAINLKDKFKYYSYNDINQCSNEIEYLNPIMLDITGEKSFKWRVVAQNYIVKDTDTETDSEIYCTDWSISDEFFIDMEYASLNLSFVLNDVYIDYYDLYMTPTSPLIFYEGQKFYSHYGVTTPYNSGEIIDVEKLDLINEEIYLSSSIFANEGSIGYTFVAYDEVENVNIFHKHFTFNIVTPGTFSSYESPSNIATIDINNNFFESNVLIQEINLEDYKYIDNAISDIVFVQSSHNYNYDIKFNIDLFDDQYKNSLDNLVIYEVVDDKVQILNTFYDLDYIYANGKTNSKYGVKVSDNFVVNEVPNKISIMDCYPNPFNPTLTVYYILDKKSFVDVSIYDLLGKKVINLEKEVKDIGEYYTTWNGEDSYGNLMPSGIYFVKMNYDNNQLINKVTLLK